MHGVGVANAYTRSARHRRPREQEADVFLRVNAVLRGALDGDSLTVTKALADNARLWSAVMDAMRHPDNMLPRPLRAAIISVGAAVQRVGDDDPPDFGFLIGINEQVAAGLAGL